MIDSPTGKRCAQQLREVFGALADLDKRAPNEVAEILATMVTHVRSWKPHVLLAAQQEVGHAG